MDVDWCAYCGRHTRGNLYCSYKCMVADSGTGTYDTPEDGTDPKVEDEELGESDSIDEKPEERPKPVAAKSSSYKPVHYMPESLKKDPNLDDDDEFKVPYDILTKEDEILLDAGVQASLTRTFDGTYHQVKAFKAKKKAQQSEEERKKKQLAEAQNFLRSYQKQRSFVTQDPSASQLSRSIPISTEELDPAAFLKNYDYGVKPGKYERDDFYVEEIMKQPWFQSSK